MRKVSFEIIAKAGQGRRHSRATCREIAVPSYQNEMRAPVRLFERKGDDTLDCTSRFIPFAEGL